MAEKKQKREKTEDRCPNCGYCPHCGQSTKPHVIPMPYPQPYPVPYLPWPPRPWEREEIGRPYSWYGSTTSHTGEREMRSVSLSWDEKSEI